MPSTPPASTPPASTPLSETTPLTEAIEASVDRLVESVRVLGAAATKTVSDLTRRETPGVPGSAPDPSVATTVLNLASWWTAAVHQSALGWERWAGNLTLASRDHIEPPVWTSVIPVAFDHEPPPEGWTFRIHQLVASTGRSISDREVAFATVAGTEITTAAPVLPGWDRQLHLRVVTWGWVPTGPVAGQIAAVHATTGLIAGPVADIYVVLG